MPSRALTLLALLAVCGLPAIAQDCALRIDPASASSHFTVADFTEPDPDQFTFEFWFRAQSGANGDTDQYIARHSTAWSARWDPSTGDGTEGVIRVVFATRAPDSRIITMQTQDLVEREWHHIAVRWDNVAGEARIFVNGSSNSFIAVRVGERLVDQGGTALLSVGSQNAGTRIFDGRIDELRIWNRFVSRGEIRDNMHRSIRRARELVACWPFDGNYTEAVLGRTATLIDPQAGSPPAWANGEICAGLSAYPGTYTDFVQTSGVDGVLTTDGDKPVRAGDNFTLQVTPPRTGLDGIVTFWGFQVRPATNAAPQPSNIPALWIDPNQSYELVDVTGITTAGVTLNATIPAGSGAEVWSQAIAFAPFHPDGYVTTDAHRVILPSDVYVSASAGSSGGAGTAGDPLRTIEDGYALAKSFGSATLFIEAGTYSESPVFDHRISVFGGYQRNGSTWTAPASPGASTAEASRILTNQGGLRIRDIQASTTISGLWVIGANGVAGTGNVADIAAFGADVRNCSDALLISDCRFTAGRGADGTDGVRGANDAQGGSSGSNGQDGVPTTTRRSRDGGSGGGGFVQGGSGGRGGAALSSTGAFRADDGRRGNNGGGCNNGGAGGSRSSCGEAGDGNDGGNGSDGNNGSNGQAATSRGGVATVEGGWEPGVSTRGTRGGNGCGGGGGGGGGGAYCVSFGTWYSGGGGGGGGGGAQGGRGGGAGTEGGPSIAVWLFDASPTFARCHFTSGLGGDGGNGADGRPGGRGGSGGGGGNDRGIITQLSVLRSGKGGDGGRGGDGGPGGGGGGAHGGDSWCVLMAGTSAPIGLTDPSQTFNPGTAGLGGMGGARGDGNGSGGGDGQNGRRGQTGSL